MGKISEEKKRKNLGLIKPEYLAILKSYKNASKNFDNKLVIFFFVDNY